MEAYRNADLEYQRFGEEVAVARATEVEIKLWVACIVILMINVVYEILYFTALFSVVTTHGYLGGVVAPIIVNLVAILILGNGLFGKRFQKISLGVYIIVFELIPLGLNSVLFFVVNITFYRWKEWAKKAFPNADSTAVVICVGFILLFSSGYHLLAAWVINKYRKLAHQ